MKRFIIIEMEGQIPGVRNRALVTSSIKAENFVKAHIKFLKLYPQFGAKLTYVIDIENMNRVEMVRGNNKGG